MRKLAQVLVQPVFIEVDDDGEVTAGPYGLSHPQTGQPIQFTVPAKEWKTGWDWESAINNILSQLDDVAGNGASNRAARRRAAKPKAAKIARRTLPSESAGQRK